MVLARADHWLQVPIPNHAVGPAPVPEPATLILLGVGLLGLAGMDWRRRR